MQRTATCVNHYTQGCSSHGNAGFIGIPRAKAYIGMMQRLQVQATRLSNREWEYLQCTLLDIDAALIPILVSKTTCQDGCPWPDAGIGCDHRCQSEESTRFQYLNWKNGIATGSRTQGRQQVILIQDHGCNTHRLDSIQQDEQTLSEGWGTGDCTPACQDGFEIRELIQGRRDEHAEENLWQGCSMRLTSFGVPTPVRWPDLPGWQAGWPGKWISGKDNPLPFRQGYPAGSISGFHSDW